MDYLNKNKWGSRNTTPNLFFYYDAISTFIKIRNFYSMSFFYDPDYHTVGIRYGIDQSTTAIYFEVGFLGDYKAIYLDLWDNGTKIPYFYINQSS